MRPVVIESETRVVDRRARGQAIVQPRTQRLGHHHIGGDRQDRPVDAPIQAGEIATAGKHDLLRTDLAMIGAHTPATALAGETMHAAVFVHPYATLAGRAGQATRIGQWIKVQGVALVQPVAITPAADQLAELPGGQPLPVDAKTFGQQLLATTQHRRVTEPVRPDNAFVHRVAGDGELVDPVADEVDRIDGAAVQRTRTLGTQAIEQRLFAKGIAGEDETAVSAGGAEADAFVLQQDHIADAPLGEAERGVQSGEAAADNDDVRLAKAFQRRIGLDRARLGLVIRRHHRLPRTWVIDQA